MASAVCWKCIKDKYLRDRVKREGKRLKCTECNRTLKGFTVEHLGEVLEPILYEHIEPGEQIPKLDDDDQAYYEQEGDDLLHWVQTVLGQDFDFDDEIVEAVIAAEHVDVRDGDIPFFDITANYEDRPPALDGYYAEWNYVLEELKHSRRFFNSSAQALFGRLFHDVETMRRFGKDSKPDKVVWEFPEGSMLYRARICGSSAQLNEFHAQPYETCGPPAAKNARAGRMNVEGVAVFYGATDQDTCLAEMRPALGGDTAIIALETTKPLRMLDFTRLEKSHGEGLSYFQPDFSEEVRRREFLRRLHTLISQPVVPGREEDYLITQTMAEYLAHIHQEPFDGIFFKSAQRAGGTNVVLFSDRNRQDASKNKFPLKYAPKSLKLFSTKEIQYKHSEKHFVEAGGEIKRTYVLSDDL